MPITFRHIIEFYVAEMPITFKHCIEFYVAQSTLLSYGLYYRYFMWYGCRQKKIHLGWI